MYEDIIGYLGGGISSISLIFQVYETYKTKIADHLSFRMLCMNLTGCILIAIYAIIIQRVAIYATISLSITCFIILIIMKVIYDKDKKMISASEQV